MTTLLFYKGTKTENKKTTLWDQIICFVTRSRFSHVEVSVCEGERFHRCLSASTRDGGVRYTNVDAASGNWVKLRTDKPIDLAWLETQLGAKYDYMGLIGTVIRLSIFNSKGKWFCSELLATALYMDNPSAQTPESIFRSLCDDTKTPTYITQ